MPVSACPLRLFAEDFSQLLGELLFAKANSKKWNAVNACKTPKLSSLLYETRIYIHLYLDFELGFYSTLRSVRHSKYLS